jgi:pyruvate dehydrogenase E2 component (dihydrolipoamide acetyltransferase)
VYHHECHLGIAVDTEHGLLAPVVHNAERKTVRELASSIAELAGRARARTISRDDLAGATFSITNLGGIGGTSFTPIVVPPQVAILGLSRARSPDRDRIALPLSLSYDHRAVDGAEAARFVAELVRLLESPMQLWLEC